MIEVEPFHPAQCRAARALVGWNQTQLAEDSKVGVMTVKRLESGKDVRQAQAAAIRQSLLRRGVVFLDDPSVCNGEAVSYGVVLKTAPSPDSPSETSLRRGSARDQGGSVEAPGRKKSAKTREAVERKKGHPPKD